MNDAMIPYGRQEISEEDIQSVVEVLRSAWLTQGPKVAEFEEAVCNYTGAKYAVAVSSGTAALHLAALTLGLGPDDEVITSPITFVASANCILYAGARVRFADIDASTCLDPADMAKKICKETKAIIPVHFAGQPCNMTAIRNMAKEKGLAVIEDAAHALGSEYKGEKVGSCKYSEMTIFSFHPVKTVTTGEGGMVMTNRKDLYEKLLRLRSHGITRDPQQMQQRPDGPWYYQQIELGFNYRMTDIQAALGISQMKRLDEFISRRRKIAARYNRELSEMNVTLPVESSDSFSAFHLYVIRLHLDKIRKTHRQVFEELRGKGVGVNLHYIPVHTQPYYQKMGFKRGDFPSAERYYGEAISLPMYAGLTEGQQKKVIDCVKDVIGE